MVVRDIDLYEKGDDATEPSDGALPVQLSMCTLEYWRPVFGLATMALSAMFFSVMTLLIHFAAAFAPSFDIVLARASVAYFLTIIVVKGYLKISILGPHTHWKLLWARGLVGFFGSSAYYYALTKLPLPEATVLIFTAPVWTVILARIFQKEQFSGVQVFGTLLSLAGVIMVARPSFIFGHQEEEESATAGVEYATGSERTFAILLGCGGSVASATTNILVRELKEVHPLVISGYLFACCVLFAPFCAVAFQTITFTEQVNALDWIILIGTGVLGFIGQFLKTQALRIEKAGPASMIRNLDIVFAFLWQVVLIGEAVALWSVAGAICIVIAALTIGIYKLRQGNAVKTHVPLVNVNIDASDAQLDDIESIELEDIETTNVEINDVAMLR